MKLLLLFLVQLALFSGYPLEQKKLTEALKNGGTVIGKASGEAAGRVSGQINPTFGDVKLSGTLEGTAKGTVNGTATGLLGPNGEVVGVRGTGTAGGVIKGKASGRLESLFPGMPVISGSVEGIAFGNAQGTATAYLGSKKALSPPNKSIN